MSYLNSSYSIVGTNYSVPIRDAVNIARPANSASLGALQYPTGSFYWVGSSLNWTDPNGWSFESGGSPNGYYTPSATDTVTFDSYSANCSITSSVACGPVIFNAYSGYSISISSSTLTINGSLTTDTPIGAKIFGPAGNSALLISGSPNYMYVSNGDNFGSISLGAISGGGLLTGANPTYISFYARSVVAYSGGTVNCWANNSLFLPGGYSAVSGGTINGSLDGIQATVVPGATGTNLSVINANVTGYGSIGAWMPNYSATQCDCNVNLALLAASGNTLSIYGGNYIYGAVIGNPAAGVNIVLGAGTPFTLAYIGPTTSIRSGTVTTLDVSDALGVSMTSISCGTFQIDGCSSVYTMSLNSIGVSSALSITGSSVLYLTNTITYNGSKANSRIRRVYVKDSNASYGNKIYALGPGVKDLKNNPNWVFMPPAGHPVMNGVWTGAGVGVA